MTPTLAERLREIAEECERRPVVPVWDFLAVIARHAREYADELESANSPEIPESSPAQDAEAEALDVMLNDISLHGERCGIVTGPDFAVERCSCSIRTIRAGIRDLARRLREAELPPEPGAAVTRTPIDLVQDPAQDAEAEERARTWERAGWYWWKAHNAERTAHAATKAKLAEAERDREFATATNDALAHVTAERDEAREKARKQARELAVACHAAERRNRELDALHYVWCDGGCDSGVHRYGEHPPLTKEIVEEAQRYVTRLTRRWNNTEFKALPAKDRMSYHARLAAAEASESECARLRAEVERRDSAIAALLTSADSEWETRNEGHDWREACQEARGVLGWAGRIYPTRASLRGKGGRFRVKDTGHGPHIEEWREGDWRVVTYPCDAPDASRLVTLLNSAAALEEELREAHEREDRLRSCLGGALRDAIDQKRTPIQAREAWGRLIDESRSARARAEAKP